MKRAPLSVTVELLPSNAASDPLAAAQTTNFSSSVLLTFL
jgi:hypothetical protein